MIVDVEPIRTIDLNPGDNLFQSPLWAGFRSRQNYEILPFRFRYAESSSRALAMLRPLGRDLSFAYLPWAPDLLVEEDRQGRLLEALSEALREYLPTTCAFIRWDLSWKSPYQIDDSEAAEPGNTGRPPNRIRELRMNFNTDHWNLVKAPTNSQPVDTVVLNPRRGESALLSDMKTKTRYNIRLSFRKGVEVENAPLDKLHLWYEMYARTMERKGVKAGPYSYFATLFEAVETLPPPLRPRLRLLLAKKGGEYLAGIVLAITGRYALYLYGASAPRKRNLMPTYRLQWEAIQEAKRSGCSAYDLHGVPANKSSSNPMYGLLQFKTGFGGELIHRRGCWDYPLDHEIYRQAAAKEAAESGYYV